MGLIAIVMFRNAIAHIRSPSNRTANAVAVNTAVLLYFIILAIAGGGSPARASNLALAVVGIVGAYLTYRLLLKPAVLRLFPPEVNAD